MRLGVAITVAAVALTACVGVESADPDENVGLESQGNVALFCRVWPDARERLLGMFSGETSIAYEEQATALEQFFANVDSTAPTAVRTEWNRAYVTFQQVSDLLFITGYGEGTIRAVHLNMAFGDKGPEAAFAEAESAVGAVDEWTLTACGDFASRWPELERILQINDRNALRDLGRNIDQYEAALAAGGQLLPDEVAEDWDTALRYLNEYFAVARSIDFDFENLSDGESWESRFTDLVGLPLEDASDAVEVAKEAISAWVEANSDPAAVPQGAAGGPGSLTIRILPHPYLTNRRLLLALLPPGSDFAMVRTVGDYVAGSCTEVEEAGGQRAEEQEQLEEQERLREQERLEAEEERRALEERIDLEMKLEDEEARRALEEGIWQGDEEERQALEEEVEERIRYRQEERIMLGREHEQQREQEAREALEEEEERLRREQEWEEQFSRPLLPIASFPGTQAEFLMREVCWLISPENAPALIPGGSYELFVGAYYGDPGSYGLYFAAPEACTQFPVIVSGDTVIDLPELEVCNLEPLGSPEEIARRTPPPLVAGGTLRVQIDSALLPIEFDFCRLDGALLPAGTSLNDVGRGEGWPSGMFSFAGRDPNHIQTESERRWITSPGLIPMLVVPPSGGSIAEIWPSNAIDGPWDVGLPEPVPLTAGSYDLRIEETCEDEDAHTDEEVRHRCAFVTVEVDGATIVKMPGLGACP